MKGKKDKNTEQKEEGKKIEELEERVKELENLLARAVADYRNLEKRVEEEKKEVVKYANKQLLERLLPAFDNLFLAEKHVKDQGLKLSIKKLVESLEAEGVKRIEAQGKDFTADFMECVDTVEGDAGKVIVELLPGFTLYGKLLRPAKVRVGKDKKEHPDN